MKANLSEQEPRRLEKWNNGGLYRNILKSRKANELYVLHDGPPYANGNIHIGTALNKILKDIIVKTKVGFGFNSPYVPGWDCHGLPIELKVDKELGSKKEKLSKAEFRKLCRRYASRWIDIQREEFKRLGVLGDWESPYITMNYSYEAITLKEFYKVYNTGGVYKGSKPVYWCPSCVTALAEAEVEYREHQSHSIFVKFKLADPSKVEMAREVSAVIWTTTPWTLPANMGISLNPYERYCIMRVDKSSSKNLKPGELLLIAKPLAAETSPLKGNMGVLAWSEIREVNPQALDGAYARHPFYEKDSLFMLGEHVLMTDGTGLVHTAPAHGLEDYEIGLRYGLNAFNPVDDNGRFIPDLPLFAGRDINEATADILKTMDENGSLIASGILSHSYPHCWRCKKPVIYRSTPQWFISMQHNDLRKNALSAILNSVRWIPSWGSNRIYSMVENRPDWCISRQRNWGVPIALFVCRECGHIITNEEIQSKIIASFEEHGADAWYENDIPFYLGEDYRCPKCGSNDIHKEMDILDVWFDSGTSYAAVCEVREELGGKADMYLEGTDQHRGWFHSSLLESIATRGKPPYKEVLTHGFVVDDDLQKMSKSVGNALTPDEILKDYGAEILRLWVAAEDYTNDIRISNLILKRLVESYRKIRNTCRFLLGNLYDFSPTDALKFEDLKELDRFILL
jgi:isoleucyl-tRNA synthetase